MSDENKGKDWLPSPDQMRIAELLANPEDRRSMDAKCQEVGIAYSTLWRWNQIDDFRAYVKERIMKNMNSYGLASHAAQCLYERMKVDTSAIKLFYEITREYAERIELTGSEGDAMKLEVIFVAPAKEKPSSEEG